MRHTLLSCSLLLVLFSSLFALTIKDSTVTLSNKKFEVVDQRDFLNSNYEDIVACSPNVTNMMTNLIHGARDYKYNLSSHINETSHPMIVSLYSAFAHHKNITISPDMIWLLICQGVSVHINENIEEYRDFFTASREKEQITVRVDELTLKFNDKHWTKAIKLLSDSVGTKVDSSLFKLFDAEFSTTGLTEKTAFRLTLLNTVKEYYDLNVATMCGFPEIHIEGEREDWLWMIKNIDAFNVLGLEWWTKEVKPILEQFVAIYDGEIDRDFWCSILKEKSGSGIPLRINGWIKELFPYTLNAKKKFIRNPYLGVTIPENPYSKETEYGQYYTYMRKTKHQGLKVSAFANGLQETPFTWHYNKKKKKMLFYSGFIGSSYDHETGMVTPVLGYLIGKK